MNIEYYESHITIEPVFEKRLELFSTLCATHKFKPAKLFMQKNRSETPERSNKDTFCTGHSKDYLDLYDRMRFLRFDLESNGFEVWRCKIEAIVYDVKYDRSSLK